MSNREAAALVAVQSALATPPLVRTARALSLFGEHGAGWLALGVLGALTDREHRPEWTVATGAVFTAHAASVVVKRVVRRRRPSAPDVRVLAGTPSSLSFPSSHAASTTTAAIMYGALTNRPLVPLLVPPMLVSRLVLGVHYPSDVLAGAALGAVVARGARRLVFGRAER